MKYIYLSIIIVLLFSCSQSDQKLIGPYLGQNLPGNSPELFAPGIVNDGIATRDITFTPDGKEIYFGKNIGTSTFSTILFCKETEEGWTQAEVVPFAQNPEFIFIEPFKSALPLIINFKRFFKSIGETEQIVIFVLKLV